MEKMHPNIKKLVTAMAVMNFVFAGANAYSGRFTPAVIELVIGFALAFMLWKERLEERQDENQEED